MNTIIRPVIVCLCGSTKFKDEFILANKQETMKGKIVLSVGLFGHADNIRLTDEDKEKLDELHLRKIDIADEVLILNVKGYIGNSTLKELRYAYYKDKKIRFLEKGYTYGM